MSALLTALLAASGLIAGPTGPGPPLPPPLLYVVEGNALTSLVLDDNSTPMAHFELTGDSPHSLVIQPGAGFVYWVSSQLAGGEIWRAALDSVPPDDDAPIGAPLVTDLDGGVEGLALDSSAGWLFWIETITPLPAPPASTLWRARLDGTQRAPVIVADERLFPAALHPIDQQLYYATGGGALVRASYAGSDPTTLLTAPDAVTTVAVDALNGALYYHRIGTGLNALFRASLDGQGAVQIAAVAASQPSVAVDPIGGAVYYTVDSRHYERRRLDGTEPWQVLPAVPIDPTEPLDPLPDPLPAYRGLALAVAYCGDCDDGDPCTDGVCGLDRLCAQVPRTCDDGVACTLDSCAAGVGCVSTVDDGACDDGVACTTDACDAVAGCSHAPETAACDDGDACTIDRCERAAGCVSDTPTDCDDGNPCTLDGCDPTTGCVVLGPADGPPCEDGDACTVGDRCRQGTCVGGDPASCDDDNPCTLDSCAPPPASASSCSGLGWSGGQNGDRVCANSQVPDCVGPVDFAAATAACAAVGARLCTQAEVEADETRGTGCGYDAERIWTSTSCDSDAAWTQAGRRSALENHPRECTKHVSATAHVRCCADRDPSMPPPRCLNVYADAACDDGDPCTRDACQGGSGCVSEPIAGCGAGADTAGGDVIVSEPDADVASSGDGGCQTGLSPALWALLAGLAVGWPRRRRRSRPGR